ncbi:MAG: hypothetical protein KF713_18920 [Turneriella sp.]|nr:hypothetical protein [Turneriella sp.]
MQVVKEIVKTSKEEAKQQVFTDLWDFCMENMRWVPEWKSYALFDKKRWRAASELVLVRLLVRILRVEYDLEDRPVDSGIISALNSMARKFIQALKPHIVFAASGFDADPNLLNMQNGTLDLRTMQLMDHDPKHNCSKITGAGYNVNADHPALFLQVLSQMISLSDEQIKSEGYEHTENEQRIEYFRQLLCTYLLGQNADSLIHFLVGEGRNGKSVVTEDIHDLFGGYATAIHSRVISQRYPSDSVLAHIARNRLGIVSEVGAGSELNSTTAKLLTGGDRVPDKDTHLTDAVTHLSTHLLVQTNYLPRIKDRSLAIWRRVRVIRCGKPIAAESCDRELRFKLQDEADATISWILKAQDIVRHQGLVVPKSIVDATNTYKEESNPLSEYLDYFEIESDRSKITKAHPYFLTSTDAKFIHDMDTDIRGGHKISPRELGILMKENLLPAGKRTIGGKTYRGYFGIRPKSDVPTVEINYGTLTQIINTQNRAVD